MLHRSVFYLPPLIVIATSSLFAQEVIETGTRRELFVDGYLIDRLEGAHLVLHEPFDRGPVLYFDKPWEGPFCAYVTVLYDGETYKMYYRGAGDGRDPSNQVTCYAESDDGIRWTKPNLGFHKIAGSYENNVILQNDQHNAAHNFSPMLDTNPSAPPDERYKAVGGTRQALYPLTSADGVRWRQSSEKPIITIDEFGLDSQNVVFWSPAEQKYLLYCRLWVKDPDPATPPNADLVHGIRTIARAESTDFVHWTQPKRMKYSDTGSVMPSNHFYTNQTHPYFRAPHIYVATAARFMPGRRALSKEQAKVSVHQDSYKDTSDTVFMTSRGDYLFDRTFLGAFIRPGIGPRNWVTRTNYPALNVVPTGKNEMSIYLNKDYGQDSAHVTRYSLRLDGFSSLQAPHEGGQMVTKPLRFQGDRLTVNYSTSAAGGIRVECQDAAGLPIPGYALADCRELIGDDIARTVSWSGGANVAPLAGREVRLRFVMQEADLYAIQFVAD